MSYNLYTYNEPHSAHMTYTIQILLLKKKIYEFGDGKNSQPTLRWFLYIKMNIYIYLHNIRFSSLNFKKVRFYI